MKNLSVALVLALAACGGGNKPAPAAPVAPAAPAAPAAGTMELGELKFYAGDEVGLQMHANGHFEVRVAAGSAAPQWQEVGMIAADGTISSADGAKHGQIKPDGTLVGPEGQVAPFKLDGETLVVADKKITIDDKGILHGGVDDGKPMRIEGATTPGLKRTALILLALLMAGPREPSSTSGTSVAPPAH